MTEETKTRDTEITKYLPLAVLATVWVLALPVVVVTAMANMMDPAPSRWASAVIGVSLSIVATIIGTGLWIRRPGSGVVSFGDLMLWGWLRRYRAERKLVEASAVLGFDRKGRPLGNVNLSVDEQLKILHELNDALETKDPYTHGHSRRVERYCFRMGMHLGLPQKELDDLRLAAALHDVGKVAVPDEILRKPGRLDDEEKAVMNLHPVVGERMVSDIGNADIITAIRHHHEAFAGGSYPDGIEGGTIPLFSRIIAVADSYDAMTSTRPYRAGMPRKKAVAIVTAESGTQFDPEVVDAFLAQHSMPLPIPAALAHLFELPRNMLANMAVWAKQMGASALASAAGATGMSVVVAAALVAPAAGPQPSAPPEIAIVQDTSDEDDSTEDVVERPLDRNRHSTDTPDPRPAVAVATSEPTGGSSLGDQVLGIRIERPEKEPKGQGPKPNPPGKGNPPVNPPPVEPPPTEPPVEPIPPVEPPVNPPGPPNPPPSNGGGGGGSPSNGGGGTTTPPPPPPPPPGPPEGGGGMPPPGPPATTPPHTPGTDPRPDTGQDNANRPPAPRGGEQRP